MRSARLRQPHSLSTSPPLRHLQRLKPWLSEHLAGSYRGDTDEQTNRAIETHFRGMSKASIESKTVSGLPLRARIARDFLAFLPSFLPSFPSFFSFLSFSLSFFPSFLSAFLPFSAFFLSVLILLLLVSQRSGRRKSEIRKERKKEEEGRQFQEKEDKKGSNSKKTYQSSKSCKWLFNMFVFSGNLRSKFASFWRKKTLLSAEKRPA